MGKVAWERVSNTVTASITATAPTKATGRSVSRFMRYSPFPITVYQHRAAAASPKLRLLLVNLFLTHTRRDREAFTKPTSLAALGLSQRQDFCIGI